MRTKQIINGFNNSQKFRFIVRHPDSDNTIDFGMTLTIRDFFDKCATASVRRAVTEGLVNLAYDRHISHAKHGWSGMPTGLVKRITLWDPMAKTLNIDVQIDLM